MRGRTSPRVDSGDPQMFQSPQGPAREVEAPSLLSGSPAESPEPPGALAFLRDGQAPATRSPPEARLLRPAGGADHGEFSGGKVDALLLYQGALLMQLDELFMAINALAQRLEFFCHLLHRSSQVGQLAGDARYVVVPVRHRYTVVSHVTGVQHLGPDKRPSVPVLTPSSTAQPVD
jgi:hypothetical protein